MIISSNIEPNRVEFDKLLQAATNQLNQQATKSSKNLSILSGNKLEPYVKDIMSELAVNTVFENSIELIGGQRFPDIIAKKYFGVEVKTTTQNHWKTTGNSVLESTRVDGVERIFMLFAKLASPIEFRCKPYEECLAEVVVTHSPRYLIDMNLEKGNTIFDKIQMPYDTLRKTENPIKPIVSYYKSKLKPGEELWWIDQQNSRSSNLVIKIWNNLDAVHRQEIKNKSMIYFPELFSNSNDKFSRLAIWLITSEGIVCPNVRDLFTAGGKGDIVFANKTYRNMPRIFLNLFENSNAIKNMLHEIDTKELSEYWSVKTSNQNKVNVWISLVENYSNKLPQAHTINLKEFLNNLFL